MIADNSSITYSYGEFAMTLDGHAIGAAPNPAAADEIINQTAFEWAMLAFELALCCTNCGNVAHHSQACPEIRSVLFAPLRCVACGDAEVAPPIDVEYSPVGWA